MAYPRRLLDDHEEVTVDLHPHWWFLAPPIVAVVASMAAGIVVLVVTDIGSAVRAPLVWLSIAAILASAVWLLLRYFRWLTTHFVITNHRVIFRTGLFAKRGVEIPLERVNTVHFHQRVFQRLVGAGDLLVESGGESGQQRFTDIRQPDRVQRVIHAAAGQRAERASGGGVVDVAGQLERLEQMVERGTLSPEEFDRQKQRLLGW